MGKDVPRSFEKIRSGEQLNLKMRGFTNVASLTAAGLTAARNVGAVIYLSTGGTGSVPCLAISDGTNWKQIAIGANAILALCRVPPAAPDSKDCIRLFV